MFQSFMKDEDSADVKPINYKPLDDAPIQMKHKESNDAEVRNESD